MATAPNRPRNSRTANGLKRGIHIEWDAPKPKPEPKKKVNPVEVIDRLLADREAYSASERKNFNFLKESFLSMQAEIESLRDRIFDMQDKTRWEP